MMKACDRCQGWKPPERRYCSDCEKLVKAEMWENGYFQRCEKSRWASKNDGPGPRSCGDNIFEDVVKLIENQ